MAEGRSTSNRVLQNPPPSSSEERGGRLWGWVFFSSLLHAALIWGLFFFPHVPSSRAQSYPVYTVDLVGGEKLGGTTLRSGVKPASSPKKKIKKRKVKPPLQTLAAKKEKKKKKKKIAKKPSEQRKKGALKKAKKKEVKKKPPPKQGIPDQLREKLIQAALERVKERTKTEQKEKKGDGISSRSDEDKGAAALGKGGKGGGIIKGVEFLIYRNRMLYLIRESWTWVGKRSNLEVTVRFGIREDGDIVGLRVLRASGDSSYDDSVFRAVRKVSPLPPPPENYRNDFMEVELTFRPKDLSG